MKIQTASQAKDLVILTTFIAELLGDNGTTAMNMLLAKCGYPYDPETEEPHCRGIKEVHLKDGNEYMTAVIQFWFKDDQDKTDVGVFYAHVNPTDNTIDGDY